MFGKRLVAQGEPLVSSTKPIAHPPFLISQANDLGVWQGQFPLRGFREYSFVYLQQILVYPCAEGQSHEFCDLHQAIIHKSDWLQRYLDSLLLPKTRTTERFSRRNPSVARFL